MAAVLCNIVILILSCFVVGDLAANPCEFYKLNGQIVADNEVFLVNKDTPIGDEVVFLLAKNAVEVDLSDVDEPKIKYYLDLNWSSRNATDLNVVLQVRFQFGQVLTKSTDKIKGVLQCMTRLGEMVSRDIVISSSESSIPTTTEIPERLQFNEAKAEYNVPENFPLMTDITTGRTSLELLYKGSYRDQLKIYIVEDVPFEVLFEEVAFPAEPESKLLKLRLYLKSLLSYDKQNNYRFRLRASTPTASGEVLIFINVQDMDNSKPIFQHKIYNVTINRFTIGQAPPVLLNPTPSKILAVNENPKVDSKIVYKLLNCSEFATYFDIDTDTGELKLINPRKAYLHPRHLPAKLVIRAEKVRNSKLRSRTRVFIVLP